MPARPVAQRVVDGAVALAVAVLGLAEIWVPAPSRDGSGSSVASSVVVLLLAATLLVRRRHPLVTVVAVVAVFVLGHATGQVFVLFWGGFLPLLVAVFSVARHGRGREPSLGAAVGAGALLFVDLAVEELQAPSEIVFHWVVTTLVWGAGRGLQVMERRAEVSSQRAVDAEVAAGEQALRAIVEERARIARELHDVVAHAVSMIVVQAGAAEQLVDDDPAYVRTALGRIRETGAGALEEMRRVVTMLREADERDERAPAPGVDAVPALVEEVRSLGLAVSLTTEGEVRSLPAGLDLAAYRIVQEALTNVRRHAGASRADVVLRYAADAIELEVTDDGSGGNGGASNGHGLVGMRERASVYGGRLEAGPGPGQGFVVRAVLPVAAS